MFEPILERKIKVALVGCGRISANHFNAIEQHADNLALVGICDTNPENLAKAQERTHTQAFNHIDDLLNQTDADLIVLTTPSGLHPEHAIQSLKAGFHVLTEKPMATRLFDGIHMVKAADKAQKRLFVVKQNRLNPTIQRLKQAIDEGRFGQIRMVHCNVFWTRPQEYYDQGGAWRGTWEWDGGAFMNQASHYVDLMEWLIGAVESVQAMTSTCRKIETEDSGVWNIRYRNGAIGSIACTMATYPKNLEGSITILGDTGTVRVGGTALNQIQEWQFLDHKEYDDLVLNANYETHSVYGIGHPLYYKNVIDTLRGVAQPITDGRSGLKTLELLVAAARAARDNQTVSLPLVL